MPPVRGAWRFAPHGAPLAPGYRPPTFVLGFEAAGPPSRRSRRALCSAAPTPPGAGLTLDPPPPPPDDAFRRTGAAAAAGARAPPQGHGGHLGVSLPICRPWSGANAANRPGPWSRAQSTTSASSGTRRTNLPASPTSRSRGSRSRPPDVPRKTLFANRLAREIRSLSEEELETLLGILDARCGPGAPRAARRAGRRCRTSAALACASRDSRTPASDASRRPERSRHRFSLA